MMRAMLTAALLALLVTALPAAAQAPARSGGARAQAVAEGRTAPRHEAGRAGSRSSRRSATAEALAETRGDKRLGEWPREPSGKTITLTEHNRLDDALEKIASAAGWNLIANTGELGDRLLLVTIRNAPVEEALEAVLEGTPLVAARRGNTVTVAPGRAAPEQPILSGFEKPTGKRFTGDFDEEPVSDALREVAEAAGLSVVLPSGLRGMVSGHFKDAPVEDALRAMLSQAGLAAQRDGSVLTVSRGSGPSVVIQGGKRGLSFQIDGLKDPDKVQELDRGPDGTGASDRSRRRGHGGDRVLRGDQVIGPGERAGDVVVLGGSLTLEPGAAAQQVTVLLGSVELASGATVEQEVVAIGGDIHLAPGARVGGDAVSVGGKIVIDEGGEIEGQETSVDVPGLGSLLAIAGTRSGATRNDFPLVTLGHALLQFAVFFGMGLLLLVLFPRRLEALTGGLAHEPVKAVLTGILGLIALPIVAILLVVTVVGIPLIAVLVLGLVAASVMGYTALALHFGRALPFRFERGAPILHLAVGTAVLVAVGQIPILGILAWIAAWLFVLGVVLRTRFGQPPTAPPPVYGTTAPPPPAAGTAGA